MASPRVWPVRNQRRHLAAKTDSEVVLAKLDGIQASLSQLVQRVAAIEKRFPYVVGAAAIDDVSCAAHPPGLTVDEARRAEQARLAVQAEAAEARNTELEAQVASFKEMVSQAEAAQTNNVELETQMASLKAMAAQGFAEAKAAEAGSTELEAQLASLKEAAAQEAKAAKAKSTELEAQLASPEEAAAQGSAEAKAAEAKKR